MLKLQGKGDKQRLITISPAGRRILYLWTAQHDFDLVFGSQRGTKLGRRDLLRDYKVMMRAAGVPNARGWHQLRHSFGLSYVSSDAMCSVCSASDIQNQHRSHARLLSGGGR